MPARHRVAVLFTAILSAVDLAALVLLVHRLFQGSVGGAQLLRDAGEIWAGNVLAFALWYWELDGGGPHRRRAPRDFAFVQMTEPALAVPGWRSRFVDYLYLSFTNASAFGPSDTVPSSVSIVTVILVAARAVNMLG
jgi:hypothetical protein